jgi:hypothetical protein
LDSTATRCSLGDQQRVDLGRQVEHQRRGFPWRFLERFRDGPLVGLRAVNTGVRISGRGPDLRPGGSRLVHLGHLDGLARRVIDNELHHDRHRHGQREGLAVARRKPRGPVAHGGLVGRAGVGRFALADELARRVLRERGQHGRIEHRAQHGHHRDLGRDRRWTHS